MKRRTFLIGALAASAIPAVPLPAIKPVWPPVPATIAGETALAHVMERMVGNSPIAVDSLGAFICQYREEFVSSVEAHQKMVHDVMVTGVGINKTWIKP